MCGGAAEASATCGTLAGGMATAHDTATDDRADASPAFGEGLIGSLLGGDGLRAIAALMIFFGHVFVNADPGQAFENYGGAKDIVGRLDLGLGLFFALSGYLITRPFLRSFILDTGRPDVRRFARNRVLRIVPAFYVVAAIVLLRFGLDGAISPTPDNPSGTGPASEWWQILSVFTFTQSYTGGSATLPLGQAWSLDAEAAFYIAIPIAAAIAYKLAGTRIRTPPGRAKAAFAFIVGLGLVSIYLRQSSDQFSVLTSPPFIVYAFVPGIALAALEPLAAPYLQANPKRATRIAWALFATAALAWILYSSWDYAAQTTALHHALGLPVTLVLSQLSWRFVEQPFLQRRVRWAPGEPTPGPGTRPAGPAHASVQPGEAVDPQPERALP